MPDRPPPPWVPMADRPPPPMPPNAPRPPGPPLPLSAMTPARSMSKRSVRPRPIGLIVGVLLLGALGSWNVTTHPGAVVVSVALAALLVADLVASFRAVAAVDLAIVPLDDGDVNDEIRLLVSAEHQGRALEVGLAGAGFTERFVLPAPGSGVLVLRLDDPGWAKQQDLDVLAIGPFGLVGTARRVRVPINPPVAAGPPVFAHVYATPPIRPVFAGPSPGAPKGVELTRGVRPYVPGDSRRSVHWRATAHVGELMVREREGSGAVRIRVVLVMNRTGPSSVVTAGRANAIVREFVGRGCEVELVTLESQDRWLGPMTRPYKRPAMEVGVPPHSTVTAMVTDLSTLRRRLALVVVGVPQWNPSAIPTRVVSDQGDEWV